MTQIYADGDGATGLEISPPIQGYHRLIHGKIKTLIGGRLESAGKILGRSCLLIAFSR